MSLIPLASLLPANTDLIFEFEDIWRPEGYLRIRMWREMSLAENLYRTAAKLGDNVVVRLSSDVITSYPKRRKKIERFFNQALIDNFDLEIYDSPLQGHILTNPMKLELKLESHSHLFTRYIMPTPNTKLYCSFAFQENGDTEFVTQAVGICQRAIESEDLQVWHEGPSPFLNDTTNREYHAERIWKLKFIPTTVAGLGATPSKPNTGSSYTIPFYNRDDATPADPWDTDEKGQVVAQIEQGYTYVDESANTRHGVWRRHINAKKLLTAIFDAQFGTDNWEFECDDSPFSFQLARFGGDGRSFAASFVTLPDNPLYTDCTPNVADARVGKWFLIPQALLGLLDELNVEKSIPQLETKWSDFRSAMDMIHHICFLLGWIPIVGINKTNGKHQIKFKRREAANDSFSTIVPSASSVSVLEESEEGIKAIAPQSFMDYLANLGWNDDWFAKRQDETPSYVWGTGFADAANNAVVTDPMDNPYIVPAKALNAVELDVTINMGGIATGPFRRFGIATSYSDSVYWYSTSHPNLENTNVTNRDVENTEDFPCITPLMTPCDPSAPDAPSLVVDEILNESTNPTPDVAIPFLPIIKGKFTLTKSDGTTRVVTCKSYRQLLARYYSMFFVRSDSRYKRTYPTITQFTCTTPGPEFGKKSAKYLDVLHKTQLPVVYGNSRGENTETNYVRGFEQDYNTMSTSVEYNSLTPANGLFDDSFFDEVQDTGDIIGIPPNDPPPTQTRK